MAGKTTEFFFFWFSHLNSSFPYDNKINFANVSMISFLSFMIEPFCWNVWLLAITNKNTQLDNKQPDKKGQGSVAVVGSINVTSLEIESTSNRMLIFLNWVLHQKSSARRTVVFWAGLRQSPVLLLLVLLAAAGISSANCIDPQRCGNSATLRFFATLPSAWAAVFRNVLNFEVCDYKRQEKSSEISPFGRK